MARGDERVAELSTIYTDGQLKIVALQATAKKEIAQLIGTAKEKAARRLDIEQKLPADIALVTDEWRQKQVEKIDKNHHEDAKKQKEYVDEQIKSLKEEAARKQAAFEIMLEAGISSQQAVVEAKYQARKAALEQALALLEATLGKESSEYKKAYAAKLKNEKDYTEQRIDDAKKAQHAKVEIAKLEFSIASDVLGTTLDLLFQDEAARKKNYDVYAALAAAKTIVDGTKQVQASW